MPALKKKMKEILDYINNSQNPKSGYSKPTLSSSTIPPSKLKY